MCQLDFEVSLFSFLYYTGVPFPVPTAAEDYLNTIGYVDVELYRGGDSFDVERVCNSLAFGYPVLVSALRSLTAGHTWVIDGYLKQYRVGAKYGEESGDYYGTETEFREMLHCNWGWKDGLHNGYFYVGVFDSDNPVVETRSSDGDCYDKFYRIYNL